MKYILAILLAMFALGYSADASASLVATNPNNNAPKVPHAGGVFDGLWRAFEPDGNAAVPQGWRANRNSPGAPELSQGSWVQTISGTTQNLFSVHFINANEGWAVGFSNTILHTSNGGDTWTAQPFHGPVPITSYMGVRFIDANVGWAGGGYAVMRTTDGGAYWSEQGATQDGRFRNTLFAVSATTAWIPTQDNFSTLRWFSRFTVGVGEENFNIIGSSAQYYDMSFPDPNNGWAVGTGPIVRITNASSASPSFSYQTSFPYPRLTGIHMLDLNTGWVVGDAGVIMKTTNGGLTWTTQTSGTSNNLRSVHFVDLNIGWAVGGGGTILATTDGGGTWIPETSGVSVEFRRVFFVNASVGYAVGESGTILKRSGSAPTPTPTPTCTNLLQDPGFEATNGTTGTNPFWNSTSTNFGTSLCSPGLCGGGTPRTGTFWAWFGGTSKPETGTVSQTITIPSGATATLNYYLRVSGVTSPFNDVLNVKVDGTTRQTITEPGVAESTYTLRSVNLNSFANGAAHTITIEYVAPGGGVSNFNVDDVTVDIACGSPTPTPTPTPTPSATPGDIVISQIYGGGGTAGATYRNSYIEVFNRGSATVNLDNWLFQLGPSTGTFGALSDFGNMLIQPGQHRLIQLGSNGSSGTALPVTPDSTWPAPPFPQIVIPLTGKIAITKPGTSLLSGICPLPNSNIVDFVGFGSTTNCFEGSGPAPNLSNTIAAIRLADGCTDTDNNVSDFSVGAPSPHNGSSPFTPCSTPTPTPTPTPLVSNVQFDNAGYNVDEGAGLALITVTRIGDTSGTVTVDYETSDVGAGQRTDYTLASGTLTFAPGETSQTFRVLIVDDLYVEGNQTLNLTLSDPSGGAVLGSPSVAELMIQDNDSNAPANNPVDQALFFVQQHYYDFLSRFPDQGGWDYWSGTIVQCGSDQACIRNRRIDASNAFFYELEFQQTGAYVYRLYRAAFGNNQPFPNPDSSNQVEAKKVPSYAVFGRNRARVVGGGNLSQGQSDLANLFVQRVEFLAKYPTSLDGPSFVDAVLATIKNDLGVDLTSQRAALITLFNSGGRGAVMYRLADDNVQTNPINNRAFIDAEYNRAFVATQYFGYLRRDADIGGFLFWLGQVNSGPLRDTAKQHAMVCSFITSREYQERFSSVVLHGNAECPQ